MDKPIVDKLESLSRELGMTPEDIVWVALWLLEKSAGRHVEISDIDAKSTQIVTKVIDYFSNMKKVTKL